MQLLVCYTSVQIKDWNLKIINNICRIYLFFLRKIAYTFKPSAEIRKLLIRSSPNIAGTVEQDSSHYRGSR